MRKNSLFELFNQELVNSELKEITNPNSFPIITVSMFNEDNLNNDKLGNNIYIFYFILFDIFQVKQKSSYYL
jgi:hypothetical protein